MSEDRVDLFPSRLLSIGKCNASCSLSLCSALTTLSNPPHALYVYVNDSMCFLIAPDPALTGLYLECLRENNQHELFLLLQEIDPLRFPSASHAPRQLFKVLNNWLQHHEEAALQVLVSYSRPMCFPLDRDMPCFNECPRANKPWKTFAKL